MCTLLDEKWRKARKQHRCEYCRQVISPGETYRWQKLVDDCHYEIKTCKFCYDNVISTVWEEEQIGNRFDPTLYPEDVQYWACDITAEEDTPLKKAFRDRAGLEIWA